MKPLLCILSLAYLFSIPPAVAQETELGPDTWPTTLDGAVTYLVSHLSEDAKAKIRQTKYKDLIQYHHGWGTGIRNSFGLWKGNKALMQSACGKPCHPDDASMIIIEKTWEALQKPGSVPKKYKLTTPAS